MHQAIACQSHPDTARHRALSARACRQDDLAKANARVAELEAVISGKTAGGSPSAAVLLCPRGCGRHEPECAHLADRVARLERFLSFKP